MAVQVFMENLKMRFKEKYRINGREDHFLKIVWNRSKCSGRDLKVCLSPNWGWRNSSKP